MWKATAARTSEITCAARTSEIYVLFCEASFDQELDLQISRGRQKEQRMLHVLLLTQGLFAILIPCLANDSNRFVSLILLSSISSSSYCNANSRSAIQLLESLGARSGGGSHVCRWRNAPARQGGFTRVLRSSAYRARATPEDL